MIRIIATRHPFRKHYEIGCRFYCAVFTRPLPSTFLLDSGADKTTIVAERFGLDITSLERSSYALTSAGVTRPHQVKDVIIIFSAESGQPHPELLNTADVITLPDAPFHGMLGMDILDRFKWKKGKGIWILEK